MATQIYADSLVDASLIRLLRSVQLNDPLAEDEAANRSGTPQEQEQAAPQLTPPQRAKPLQQPRLQYPEGDIFVLGNSSRQGQNLTANSKWKQKNY